MSVMYFVVLYWVVSEGHWAVCFLSPPELKTQVISLLILTKTFQVSVLGIVNFPNFYLLLQNHSAKLELIQRIEFQVYSNER